MLHAEGAVKSKTDRVPAVMKPAFWGRLKKKENISVKVSLYINFK